MRRTSSRRNSTAEELFRARQAGQTLASFGWLGLAFLPLFLVIKLAPRYLLGPGEIGGLVSLCIFLLAFLLVGAQVRRNKGWAKATAAVLAVLILPIVPAGTLVGAATLYHLIRGRRAR